MISAPGLKGVIFDFGNTLIRLDPRLKSRRADHADAVARPGALRLERHLRERGTLGGGIGAEEFVARFLEVRERNRTLADASGRERTASASLEETLATLGAAPLSEAERRSALAEFFAPEVDAVVALEGAGDTLASIAGRGMRLALLSNATDTDCVAEAIRRFGWARWFEPLVVSASIGYRKPRREAFDAVLSRWPIRPAEIAMVGDSLYHDIRGAIERGLFAVHFTAVPPPADLPAAPGVTPSLSVSTHAALRRALLDRAV